MPDETPLLSARGLVKRYGALTVLSGVGLSVGRGESVAIVGASGSGKTTMLSILAGLEKPDAGELDFGGESLLSMSEAQLANWRGARIGIVFQDYHLIPSLSAWENVALPLEIAKAAHQAAKDKAMAMLAEVGLGERAQHYPHQLSGGEQQRVAMARALVSRPSLLFADEPTGNLDESTAHEIEDLLFRLIAETGLAAILVTHNQALARRCNRALTLHLGRFR